VPNKAKLTTRERTSSNVSSDNLNKGSELSFAEVDSNFINLRDQSIAISDGSTTTDIDAGETITFSGASVSGNTVTVPTGAGMTVVGDDSTGTLINGGETLKIAGGTNVTTAMSGDTLTITASGGGGASGGNLANLQVNDTTLSPVTTNNDLTLTANGTGEVIIQNLNFVEGTATINSQASNSAAIVYTPTAGQARDRLTINAGTVSNAAASSKGSDIVLMIKSGVNDVSNGIMLRDTNPFVGGGDKNDFVFFGTSGEAVETPHLWISAGGKITTRSGIKIESAASIGGAQQTGDITIIQGRSAAIYKNEFSKIVLSSLPTSNPNVAGQLYNDSGTLKISAG